MSEAMATQTAQSANGGGQGELLLQVDGLKMHFPITKGIIFQREVGAIKAVDGVTFDLYKGETLGLVGESGCGKSTTGRAILQLYRPTDGHVVFEGKDLTQTKGEDLRKMRRRMQMIFQDPYASLNPRMTVGSIISEPLEVRHRQVQKERQERVRLLKTVGLNPYFVNRYPHEFSGGQRQHRCGRALAVNPSFIVADEPISALDVSIQAQIINLLEDLQRRNSASPISSSPMISPVVRHISDRIAVMCQARSSSWPARLISTLNLTSLLMLSAVPIPDPVIESERKRIILEGDVPSPANPPQGCNFCTRCPRVMDVCREKEPPFKDYGGGHYTACWLYE
ncbi:MAG: ATP-binding cassette domain-containing protein [Caldilineaceae bacterium]